MEEKELTKLWEKLISCLNNVKLGVAGRLIYYDKSSNLFILGVHSTSPEKTEQATIIAWDNIPEELKAELATAGIGFAGKQI